jgi:hypothetical protein
MKSGICIINSTPKSRVYLSKIVTKLEVGGILHTYLFEKMREMTGLTLAPETDIVCISYEQ